MANVSTEIQQLTDAELLARFEQAHATIRGFMRDALTYARAAGEVLTEFHTHRVPRGQWLMWLKDRGVSFSTAANYRRVFDRWSEIEPKLQADASFTLADALKLLAGPRRQPKNAPDQLQLPGGALYTVPMISDWITVLRTMPAQHQIRSREALLQLRDQIDAIVGGAR